MWVSSRDETFFQPELMSTHQLSSEIVISQLNGKDVFLDPGTKYCPFGLIDWRYSASKGLRQTHGKETEMAESPVSEYNQAQIQRLARASRLAGLPPIITFQSVIDFTVSTQAILTGLYAYLPDNGSEIVLFDVNRTLKFSPLLRESSYVAVDRLTPGTPQTFRFTVITNAGDDTDATVERSIAPGELKSEVRPLKLPYPPGIFSLSHLAIPIPMDDPLYGMQPDPRTKGEYGYSLGAMDARGERGALIVDQDFLTRLPSNPFFPYLLGRVDDGIDRPSGPSVHNIPTPPSSGLPARLRPLLSTFDRSDRETGPYEGP